MLELRFPPGPICHEADTLSFQVLAGSPEGELEVILLCAKSLRIGATKLLLPMDGCGLLGVLGKS